MKNTQIIADANSFLKDYEKSGFLYRATNYLVKLQAEAEKSNAQADIEKNTKEIRVLENTEIKIK